MDGALNEDVLCKTPPERPLSPILNTKLTKNTLLGRKNRRLRARRVIPVIKEDVENELLAQNAMEEKLELPDLNILENPAENIYEKFNKIKEVESQRTKMCKLFYEANNSKEKFVTRSISSDNSDFEFKVPISPARKKRKSSTENKQNMNFNNERGDFASNVGVEADPSFYTAEVGGFKTASGKEIQLPSNFNEIQQKLFSDVLNESQSEIRSASFKSNNSFKNVKSKNHKHNYGHYSPLPSSYYSSKSLIHNMESEYLSSYPDSCDYSSSYQETPYLSASNFSNGEEVNDSHIIKAADSLIDKFSQHLQTKIKGIEEETHVQDRAFVSEAKIFTNHVEESIALSDNKSVLSDTADTVATLEQEVQELHKIVTQSRYVCAPVTIETIPNQNLERKDSLTNILSDEKRSVLEDSINDSRWSLFANEELFTSLTDFCGFHKGEYRQSNKILDLCNKIIEMMNEQINLISSRAQSIHSVSSEGSKQIQKNVAEEAEKLFKVNNLKKIVEYCKNHVRDFNLSNDLLCEEIPMTAKRSLSEKSTRASKKIKTDDMSLEMELNKYINTLTSNSRSGNNKTDQKSIHLDKIDEVNESNSTSAGSNRSEACLEKEVQTRHSSLFENTSNTQLLTGYNNSLKIFDELNKIVQNLESANVEVPQHNKNESVECQTSNTKQDVKSVQVDSKECTEDIKKGQVKSIEKRNVIQQPNISEEAIKQVKSQLKKPPESREIPLKTSQESKDVSYLCKRATSGESNKSKSIFKYNSQNSSLTQELNLEYGDCGLITNNKIETMLREDLEQFKAGIAKSKKLFKEITEPCSRNTSSESVTLRTLHKSNKHSKSKDIFKDFDLPFSNTPSTGNKAFVSCGFKTASNKILSISETALGKSKDILKDASEISSLPTKNLTDLNIKKSSGTLINSEILFRDVSETKTSIKSCSKASSFNTAIARNFEDEDMAPVLSEEISNLQKVEETTPLTFSASSLSVGFKKASGKDVKVNQKALLKSMEMFKGIDEKENLPILPADNSDTVNESYLNAKQKLEKIFIPPRHLSGKSENVELHNVTPVKNIGDNNKIPKTNSAKKRLGVQSTKKIIIPEHKVEKMKQLFENLQEQIIPNTSLKLEDSKFVTNDKIGKELTVSTSTPVRNPVCSSIYKSSLDIDKMSPIKPSVKLTVSNENQVIPGKNVIFWKRDLNTENVYPFIKKINDELRLQEIRIRVLNERHKAMCQQVYLLEDENNQNRRQKPGILLMRKKEQKQISLNELNNLAETYRKTCISQELHEICSKNAAYVHFYCPWQDATEGHAPVLHTTDGSTIVPNIKDYVGLPEIKIAFETTPGVDPKLIPPGWVSNHYKWIVWKLASMERKYSGVFENCFTVDIIMQQLKYRYDREIDKSERSCLRRILEKDDTSVKRTVFLVSDVIKVAYNKHELELSDGWYSVRAVIDVPLNSLVLRKKISVGMKIITQCAELMNCDACHPLQEPQRWNKAQYFSLSKLPSSGSKESSSFKQNENVKLKIFYNCTRPAHWYVKLGFQKCCLPFPIRLATVQIEGGTIGCSKLLVVRVYPIRYMEKCVDSSTVWRNKKAEERYAAEWEGKQHETCENVSYKVQKQFEKELIEERKKVSLSKITLAEIANVHCAKTIFNLMESASDPDTFKEMLSSSQQKLLVEHQQKIHSERQQELQKRIKKEIDKLKCSKREVTEVWKLTVFDAYDKSSDKPHIFTVWKPTEEHIQMIKEGRSFLVYNILPKKSGDFSSNSRTRFHLLDEDNSKRFDEVKRRVLPISSISHTTGKTLSNEFDTVGTVVRLKIGEHDQEIWLTDSNLKLLFIKIMEGPKLCSLLDGLTVGQHIALCNLVTFGLQDKVAQAIGNQHTLVSCYPQANYLRDALQQHTNNIVDVNNLIKEADMKIEECIIRSEFLQNRNYSKPLYSSISINASEIFTESSEDNASIPAGLTKTDVAMSLINTEEFC